MRLVLLIAAVFAAAPAFAQVPLSHYRPFAAGDEWVYDYSAADTSGTDQCPAQRVVRQERVRVLGDTLVDGRALQTATCTTVSTAGVRTGENRFVAEVDADGALTVTRVRDGGGCDVPFQGQVLQGSFVRVTEPAQVTIAGMTFATPGTRTDDFSGSGPGQGGGGTSIYFAADIGPFYRRNFSFRGFPTDAAFCRDERRTLTYALVSGRTYGVATVGESDAPGSEARTLRVFPSPASVFTTLESDVRASVEVYDALGRRVATGEAAPGRALRLDVSAWPVGVYVVRSAEARTVRFVVAR